MPFIPHTDEDIQQMLAAIGIAQLADLYAEIPANLLQTQPLPLPPGLSEMEVARLIQERTQEITQHKIFIGAGAYDHHIPAAVTAMVARGEYLTAYTPYQAEASQGTLQLIWEYQTMMASLMGLAVSNASLYDGATALAEAILMAIRIKLKQQKRYQQSTKTSKVWIPQTLHPHYRHVLKTLLAHQAVQWLEIPYDSQSGMMDTNMLSTMANHQACDIFVLAQPNFLGCLEKTNELTDWAKARGAIVIGLVNPIAMAWLKPPGQWGKHGADIACGEGQPLGIPLSAGGPYFGFLCCRQEYVRELPGRIVGRTYDNEGKVGFTLTLQAREQHIRREKATSNICTNQGLLLIRATLYMTLLGAQGLKQVAQSCHEKLLFLKQQIQTLPEVKILFSSPCFHEIALQLPVCSQQVLKRMAKQGMLAGLSLAPFYPQLKNSLLVCVTETKTEDDIVEYVAYLRQIIDALLRDKTGAEQ